MNNFPLPPYSAPDFTTSKFHNVPLANFEKASKDGVAPVNYHSTTIFPEYFHLEPGLWVLPRNSRMDCVVVHTEDNRLEVKEFRRLKKGERVAVGRTGNGQEGIYVHTMGFDSQTGNGDKFAFRSNRTRETSFSIDYDELYQLLHHERENGFIVWVTGPAVVFDHDARSAFCTLVEKGFVHALLAGNALATHDIEGCFHGTALGQELYHKRPVPDGHYKHLDTINTIRSFGSMQAAVEAGKLNDGIMYSLIKSKIPYVLAGSIRDDGPLPEVSSDVYQAQDQMRTFTSQATTVIALATQLHTIAVGNMTPSYTFDAKDRIRPVYFYSVDMSEFAVHKLSDRGSLSAKPILTNVQDFVVTLVRGLGKT